MAAIVISEVLFFVFNKYGKVPDDHLKKIITNFYSIGDIRAAKELLRAEMVRLLVPDMSAASESELAKHVTPDLPRLVTHHRGDNRSAAETTDLIDLAVKCDEMNMIAQLPTFVAATYDKVPLVQADDLDVCLLAKRLAKLEVTVSQHTKSLIDMVDKVDKSSLDWPPLGQASGSSWAESVATHALASGSSESSTSTMISSSAPVLSSTGLPTPRPNVKMPQRSVQKPRVLKGKSTSADDDVKGIPRRLHAFVSRLAGDTTDQQLSAWLAKVGISGAICTPVVPRDGRTFKTAAFRVSCDAKFADLFYDEASWPAGCELRDWVFRNNVANVQRADNASNN